MEQESFKEIYHLKNQHLTDEQLKLVMEEQLSDLRNSMFGASSERYKNPEDEKKEKSIVANVRLVLRQHQRLCELYQALSILMR